MNNAVNDIVNDVASNINRKRSSGNQPSPPQSIALDLRRKYAFSLALWLLWTAVIWGHSLMSGDQSELESGFLTELFNRLLSVFGLTVSEHAVRKAAHFTEYAVLGVILSYTARVRLAVLHASVSPQPTRIVSLFGCLFVGTGTALFDEFVIQASSAGRSPQLGDVGIDTAGCLAGLILAAIFAFAAKSLKRKPLDRSDLRK